MKMPAALFEWRWGGCLLSKRAVAVWIRYDELVRDRIPQQICEEGYLPTIAVLKHSRIRQKLGKRLREGVDG